VTTEAPVEHRAVDADCSDVECGENAQIFSCASRDAVLKAEPTSWLLQVDRMHAWPTVRLQKKTACSAIHSVFPYAYLFKTAYDLQNDCSEEAPRVMRTLVFQSAPRNGFPGWLAR